MSDQGESQSQAVAPVEDRIAGLANRFRGLTEEPKQARQESAPEEPQEPQHEAPQESEQTEQIESAEPEGQAVEDDLVEFEHNGKTLKVPKELKEGHLRQADYTRKTQAVAERSRAVEQREQGLMQALQLSEHLAPALGQLSQMDQQIHYMRSQLTQQLKQNDPLTYNTIASDLTLLAQDRQAFAQGLEGHKQQLAQHLTQQRKLAMQERLQEALPKVQAAIKNFTGETGKQIADYASSQGFASEELEHISFSAPAVIALWKAKEYDRLQAAKASTKPQLGNLPPVAKPGARNAQQTEQSVRAKEMRQEWAKGGGKSHDQLAAILRNRFKEK